MRWIYSFGETSEREAWFRMCLAGVSASRPERNVELPVPVWSLLSIVTPR